MATRTIHTTTTAASSKSNRAYPRKANDYQFSKSNGFVNGIAMANNDAVRIETPPLQRVVGATERVRVLLQRVDQATSYVNEQMDRLLGSQPEHDASDKIVGGPSGQAHELHANLDYLELSVALLETQVHRLGAL